MQGYVLYWMRVNRRAESNRALEFAARRANELDLPLLCVEQLDATCPSANDRFHTFLLEGVPETERRLKERGVGYLFHHRRGRDEPGCIPQSLAGAAACSVTDDHPLLQAPPGFETVDASCVVPFRRIGKRAYAAFSLRPQIHKLLPQYLKPVERVALRRRWAGPLPVRHTPVREEEIPMLVTSSAIDHNVKPAAGIRGGRAAAETALSEFLENRLHRYARERNKPAARATSGLSPYLHFGYISSLEVALAAAEYAREHKLMAGEFLEELIVRRELAFNFAFYAARRDSLDELPAWARETLAAHAADARPSVYSPFEFEHALTHDRLWNATQRELLQRGLIHPYYRMYWGKKIIEWSATPQEALSTMVRLHDRYALDGRDPNTYANILWCFGLHDRSFPERPVFGTVRYLSLDGMRRKTDVPAYIREIEALA